MREFNAGRRRTILGNRVEKVSPSDSATLEGNSP